MLDNRGKKENENEPEESEYHFSDEEVPYEDDSEAEHATSPKRAAVPGTKKGFFSGWTPRKRLTVSAIAFFILLFIIYKIIAPSRTAPNQTIEPAVLAQQAPSTQEMTNLPPSSLSSTPPVAATVTAPPPPIATTTTTQISQQPMMPTQQQPIQPVTIPANAMPQAPSTTATNTTVATTSVPANAQNPMAPYNTMPPVMPVSSTQPVYPGNNNPTLEASANQLNTINNQLVAQMQTMYMQKLGDFERQNKVLEQDVQSLTTRVTGMENQLNQLVQLITRQQAETQAKEASPVQTTSSARAIKLPYTVQAIIPGRAWLRADNGETVTVAEGDSIKQVGKVVKIDPYDGVVEIDVGGKVVSLSYGNGG